MVPECGERNPDGSASVFGHITVLCAGAVVLMRLPGAEMRDRT
jgi:hypothetical protein